MKKFAQIYIKYSLFSSKNSQTYLLLQFVTDNNVCPTDKNVCPTDTGILEYLPMNNSG